MLLKKICYQQKKLYKKFIKQYSFSDFPEITKNDIFDEDDLIINIGKQEKFKGLLIVCPTPIGNINDISIRQYEALKNGDILACEDTRKTGKLLELVQVKKMKEKFYSEFGINFEEFVNRGGLDMNDEQINKEFFSNNNLNQNKEELNKDNNINKQKENYNDFYFDEKEIKNEKLREKNQKAYDERQKLKKENIDNLQNKINKNKQAINSIGDIIDSNIDLCKTESELKDQFNRLKLEEESVTKDYYSAVKNSEDFYKRKAKIENSEESFKIFIDPLAEKYQDDLNLSYKLRNKAKFIMNLNKKYDKKKFNGLEDEESKQDEMEEELDAETFANIEEENIFSRFKKRIKEEKQVKGRGLLMPFNQQNEEKRIPKLLKAMKLGLRVVLVSDAGTPTISDPGYRLVKEATKNGIIVEPLPGPSAVTTALSACGLPTDKFMFIGYLSKSPSEKKVKLEEVKNSGITTVLFESPVRLKRTLETIIEIFGENHRIYIGLELTKKFENHLYGKVKELLENLEQEKTEIKGEITVILAPFINSNENISDDLNLNDIVTLNSLDFAQKIIKISPNLKERELRNMLTDICNISKVKTNKIIAKIFERTNNLSKYIIKPNSFDASKLQKPEDYLEKEVNKTKIPLKGNKKI